MENADSIKDFQLSREQKSKKVMPKESKKNNC